MIIYDIYIYINIYIYLINQTTQSYTELVDSLLAMSCCLSSSFFTTTKRSFAASPDFGSSQPSARSWHVHRPALPGGEQMSRAIDDRKSGQCLAVIKDYIQLYSVCIYIVYIYSIHIVYIYIRMFQKQSLCKYWNSSNCTKF